MFLYERDEPRKTERELGEKHSKKKKQEVRQIAITPMWFITAVLWFHIYTQLYR